MADAYDLIVIGTGPGGYVCAIRAAQLGLKTAVVEKNTTYGGTCLNIGCIPSKALLHASELFEEAGHGFSAMGIRAQPELDLAGMMKFKDEGVEGNVKGVDFLLKKNKVDTYHGTARIDAPGKVHVQTENGGPGTTLETKSIVIATGSDIIRLPGIEIDEKRIVSSTGALDLTKVPSHLLIVGGGIIGLELGSVWRRLGAKVTVVEFLDRIIPGMDGEVAKQFQRILQKQGMEFRLGQKVTAVHSNGAGPLQVQVQPSQGEGPQEFLDADVVLVAIGRTPYTEGLGLENVGVQIDNKRRIVVDGHFRTNVAGIYAIGDVIRGPMLAHKAEDEGIAVAEIIAGKAGHVNYGVIPNVIYTYPEVASVGATEEELKEAGLQYNTGKFPFTANGRAKVNRQTEGFVKFLADAKTDRVLGVHILGPDAGNMIAEAAILMEFGGSSEDLARTCHAHPTLTEAVKEAALAVAKRAIHI
jgi:dihydrolipoamide dehydrogenase